MPKFDENNTCHFFDEECQFPISEQLLMELLEEAEEDELITQTPSKDDLICTNCLLATMIELLAKKLK